MLEFLEGFEKRMGFAAVVDSIVKRKNRNSEIEDWFEGEELDNLFFSLLVYIMEQTLNENEDCTIERMTGFLDDILPQYCKTLSFGQVRRLTEYMVRDILQNKGEVKTYSIMHYDKGMVEQQVRLISDKITDDGRIVYQLTDQGYDFLFRTKEIDRELDFKLEQLKLKELLKRKNYKHALKQSRELVNMLRQKKREIQSFVERIRQNIHTIDRGEHEELLEQTYNLIDEEYEGMLELKRAVEKDEERIHGELENGALPSAAMTQAMENLDMIKGNLKVVISEQRNLIAGRFRMNDIYEETIRNSFYSSMIRRYDFQKEILEPFTRVQGEQVPRVWELFRPLSAPRLEKQLNLGLLYQRQGKLRDTEDEETALDGELLEEDRRMEKQQLADAVYARLTEHIFRFAAEHGDYTFTQLYEYICRISRKPEEYVREKRIFLVMLKLYDYQRISVKEWKERTDREVPKPNGEFDLACCMYQLERSYPDFFGVEELRFEKAGKEFRTVLKEEVTDRDGITETIQRTAVMDDIMVLVKSGDGEDMAQANLGSRENIELARTEAEKI